jgi:hypothetical protein
MPSSSKKQVKAKARQRPRHHHERDGRTLPGFDVPVPVTSPGKSYCHGNLVAFNDAVFRHTVKSNVAIHERSRNNCATGACVCLTSVAKRFDGKPRNRHYYKKVTAPKFMEMIQAMDQTSDTPCLIQTMVYRDTLKHGRVAESVTVNAAALGRACATGADRHLLFATNRFAFQCLLFDIDLDLYDKAKKKASEDGETPQPLPKLTLRDDVAMSGEFMRNEFCPAIAAIICEWLNTIAVRVAPSGEELPMVTPDDFVILWTDGQPKLSLHVHGPSVAMQTSWAKELFIPSIIRPIIERVAPQFLAWLRHPEDDTVLAACFDRAPLAGSMFRAGGQTKASKPDATSRLFLAWRRPGR